MLLAVWRRPGEASFAARPIHQVLGIEPAAVGVAGDVQLATSPPAKLLPNGTGFVALLRQQREECDDSEFGPRVAVDGAGLTASAGAIPQLPLYLLRTPDDAVVAVCSQLEPLARMSGETDLDLRALICSAVEGVRNVDPGATVFRRIRLLRPGEQIRAGRDGVHQEVSTPRAGDYLHEAPADLANESAAGLGEESRRARDRRLQKSRDPGRRRVGFQWCSRPGRSAMPTDGMRGRGTGADVVTAPGDDRP